jgi:hypothetical protein
MNSTRKMSSSILVMLITYSVLCLASNLSAFDDSRQGFVLGGGLGSSLNLYNINDTDKRKSFGADCNVIVGHAPSDKWLLFLENNTIAILERDQTWAEHFSIIGSYTGGACYSFRSSAPSLNVSFGLGFVHSSAGIGSFEVGFGGLIGIGYEFSPHLIAELKVIPARTSEANGDGTSTSTRITSIAFSFNYLAF